MKNFIIKAIVFLLVFCIGFSCGYAASKNKFKTSMESEILEEGMDLSKETSGSDIPKTNSLEILREKLQKEISGYNGEWAVYVEDLSSGDFFEINNKKMVSASLIKLFIMGKTYEEIVNGTIQKENVESSLKSMITVSDNEASNILVATLGGGKYTDMHSNAFQKGLKQVNSYANKLQCTDTEQQRDMKNSRLTPIPEQNYTSVVDCGKFLSNLYHKKLVSNAADTEMLELLKQQTRTGKIPRGLPSGIICANKTGELGDVENDVAIVFSPGADYVICVMSNDVPDTSSARQNITNLSQMVYNFFN